MMSTRRSFFIFGALLAAVALLVPAAALAQAPIDPTIGPADPASYNKLEVAWTPATNEADRPDGYRVYFGKASLGGASRNASGYMDVDGGSTAKVTLTGLEDDTTYYGAVAPMDDDGTVGALVDTQGTSNQADGTPGTFYKTELAPMPSTPRNVAAMGGDETFTVSWDAPYAGGADLTITEYRVQKREVAGTLIGEWIPDESNDDNDKMGGLKVEGDMTMVTFEDLENGISYEGRVRSVNSAGRMSEWSTRDGDAPDDDATAMVGGDDMEDMEDMEETPALPLVGILALFAGLLGAARARLRR